MISYTVFQIPEKIILNAPNFPWCCIIVNYLKTRRTYEWHQIQVKCCYKYLNKFVTCVTILICDTVLLLVFKSGWKSFIIETQIIPIYKYVYQVHMCSFQKNYKTMMTSLLNWFHLENKLSCINGITCNVVRSANTACIEKRNIKIEVVLLKQNEREENVLKWVDYRHSLAW